MQNFSNNNERITETVVGSNDRGLAKFFQKTYSLMSVALLITAGTAYLLSNVFLEQYINVMSKIGSFGWIGLIALQMLIIFMIGRSAYKNQTLAFSMLVVYSIFEGFIFGSIFLLYTATSVASIFLITAVDFAAMAFYGFISKKDMSKMAPILFGSVVALIVASILNLLVFKSGLMLMLMSIAAIVIFSIYTAYDNQQLKQQYYQFEQMGIDNNGLAINGALRLYIDFINIFINLLQIFGVRRD